MKVRMPKSFLNLPKKEKDIINTVLTDELQKMLIKEEVLLQKLWLQMACIVLHDAFGFGKKRLFAFLGNWKRLYRRNAEFINSAEQEEFFKNKIDAIFGQDAYPQEFINSLADGIDDT